MEQTHLGMCGENGEYCLDAALAPWQEMQQAAEKMDFEKAASLRDVIQNLEKTIDIQDETIVYQDETLTDTQKNILEKDGYLIIKNYLNNY